MEVRVGLWRKLSAKKLVLLNCGVAELLRVPWTATRSNRSILEEISPGCSLMLKLKLQYLGHLMWRADSLEKTLMLGGIGGRRRRGWQRMRWLDGISTLPTRWTWVWVNYGSWWWTGRPGMRGSWGRKESDTTEQLNWTEAELLVVPCVLVEEWILASKAARTWGQMWDHRQQSSGMATIVCHFSLSGYWPIPKSARWVKNSYRTFRS